MKKVSVIIPVYNSEKYLNRCLESIHSQTYNNLEIIIINDGSTDESIKIINDWSEKDTRIRFYNQENRGVSEARNVGISMSTGEYIAFIDSDDWIDNKMIEILVHKIESNNCYLAICKMVIYNNGKKIDNSKESDSVFVGTEKITSELLFGDQSQYISICDKLFKTSIIKENHIVFDPTIKYAEDTEFLLKYLRYTSSFVLVGQALYHHPIYITDEKIKHYQLDDVEYSWDNSIKIFQRYVLFFKEAGMYQSLCCDINIKLLKRICGLFHRNYRYNANIKDVYRCLLKFVSRKYRVELLKIRYNKLTTLEEKIVLFSIKHKLYFSLCVIEKTIVILYYKLLHKNG